MHCYAHNSSRTMYVTTRKVASGTISSRPELEAVWIDRAQIDRWSDWQFVFVTRDPTARFLAMYSFLMGIYYHRQDIEWEMDNIYRERLGWDTYKKFFVSGKDTWGSFNTTRDFVETALPLLSVTRDLHWRSQSDRILQVGLDTTGYIKLPVQHVSQWFWRRHNLRVGRQNQNTWKFEGSPGTFKRLLDPYVRASVWKRDFELHGC